MSQASLHRAALALTAVMVLACVLLSLHWNSKHPQAAGFDEASYINLLDRDTRYVAAFDSFNALAKCYLLFDRERPPAHRVLAAPVLAVTGYSPNNARVVALLWYLVALGFIAAAAHKLAGPFAAAVTVTAVVLSPKITPAATRMLTEFPLMLAVGMTLFGFAHIWRDGKVKLWVWVVLAVGLGGGLLAKLSFAPLMILPLAATVIDSARFRDRGRLWPLLIAGVCGAALAATWYVPNFRPAMDYAAYATDFKGQHSIDSVAEFPAMFVRVILGEPLALWLLAGLALAALLARQARRGAPDRRAYVMAWVLIASPLVMLIPYLFGDNQNPRYMGVPMTTLLMGLGAMSSWALAELAEQRPGRRTAALVGMSVLALAQLGWVMVPHGRAAAGNPDTFMEHYVGQAFRTYAQYDWTAVADHPDLGWLETEPSIALIGGGSSYNRQQLAAAWLLRGHYASVKNVHYGYGVAEEDLDAPSVLDQAAGFDAVITAPGHQGLALNKDQEINQHNALLSAMLAEDPRFAGPIVVKLDEPNKTEPGIELHIYTTSRPTAQGGQ